MRPQRLFGPKRFRLLGPSLETGVSFRCGLRSDGRLHFWKTPISPKCEAYRSLPIYHAVRFIEYDRGGVRARAKFGRVPPQQTGRWLLQSSLKVVVTIDGISEQHGLSYVLDACGRWLQTPRQNSTQLRHTRRNTGWTGAALRR